MAQLHVLLLTHTFAFAAVKIYFSVFLKVYIFILAQSVCELMLSALCTFGCLFAFKRNGDISCLFWSSFHPSLSCHLKVPHSVWMPEFCVLPHSPLLSSLRARGRMLGSE